MKPSGLRAEAVERWGVKLSHDQAYREKRKVVKLVQGAGIEQFTHLRSYGQELLKSNPNSIVVIQCADSNDNHVFERIYVCLEACKAGFAKTCKPLIGLDACFLKGDYGGQLMAAVGRDGNNQNFPIAYVVVEAETKDSWQWFLDLLMHDLEGYSQRSYAFISDQQKVKHLYLYLCIYLFTYYAFRCLHIIHILHVTGTSSSCSRHQCQCGVQIMCEAFIWQLEEETPCIRIKGTVYGQLLKQQKFQHRKWK